RRPSIASWRKPKAYFGVPAGAKPRSGYCQRVKVSEVEPGRSSDGGQGRAEPGGHKARPGRAGLA
ncbi:MAG: hypothetical protein ACK5RH_10210, partial [Burkholderiales bacterium]